jgi:hypothetical protein
MKTIITLCCLCLALPMPAAEPPQKPGAGATRADWIAYDNAVAAWNQRQAAETFAAQQAARQAELDRQALNQAALRAAMAQRQSQMEAVAAQRRLEMRDQRMLDLIEEQNRLQALELLRRQGKLPK